jgi:hypothetical protein
MNRRIFIEFAKASNIHVTLPSLGAKRLHT